MSYLDDNRSSIVGKTVKELYLEPDGENLFLNFTDGTSCLFESYGDCCSHTWIEHIQGVKQLVGQTITRVEDIGMPGDTAEWESKYDCVRYYGMRIETAVGACIVDYRNDSNGYYGGSLDYYPKEGHFAFAYEPTVEDR